MSKLVVVGWHLVDDILCDRCRTNPAKILVQVGWDDLDLCHSCEKEMIKEGAEVQDEVAKAFERAFARKNEQVP
jgi:ribosomal protein L37AE/L43A